MAPTTHPFQSLCTYIGSFPPDLAQTLIGAFSDAAGPILDPFCGSGTTLLEAKRLGRSCIGVDLNPLSVVLSRAKLAEVEEEAVQSRLLSLAQEYSPPSDRIDEGHPIRIIFHERTLRQLMYLKESLESCRAEDQFLTGALLGIMHGKSRKDGTTQYLSIDMPNTFSMSPDYVRRFVRDHGLEKKPIDVFGKLRSRIRWLFRDGCVKNGVEAKVFLGDATEVDEIWYREGVEKAGCVITSPPYLKVLRYGSFNWIRLWFLGHDAGDVDAVLDSTSSLDKYLSFIASFLVSVSKVIGSSAPVALVVGDVASNGKEVNLAYEIRRELEGLVPFKFVDTVEDRFDVSGKTTRIWGEEKKGRAARRDRILICQRC